MNLTKIAIVDDHKLFRQGLTQILSRSSDYEIVLEAASGKELLDKIDTHMPDVILLDLYMEEMDGKEVSRILLEKYEQLKIIILSMTYTPELIFQMTKLGVHGYLPKDIDQTLLREAIDQVRTKGYYLNDEIAKALRQGVQTGDRKFTKNKVSLKSINVDLTEREMDVLKLICQGLNTGQIADKLFISYRTVEGHRKNLLEKTGVNNSVSLALFAVKHHLLTPAD